MHCSSFEPLLDEYVDGALAPREHALVAAHVAGCPHCAGLHEELRVIDALLLTPRSLEPAPNFTFKVMAEVRAMPAPTVHHVPALPVIAAYLAFAWTAIALFFLFAGSAAEGALGALRAAFAHNLDAFDGLAAATGHLFGPHVTNVTAAMFGMLVLDAFAALGIFGYLYSRRLGAGSREAA
jgi:anti-sigma factor RsiW